MRFPSLPVPWLSGLVVLLGCEVLLLLYQVAD